MNIENLSSFDSVLFDGLEFCKRVYELFEAIKSAPNGESRLRMKKGKVEKKLLEELLPICKYIQAKYRTGRYISVRWIDGNQKFDAELHQKGFYIEHGYFPHQSYVEITCTMHPSEYLSRERLEKVGFANGLNGLRREKSREIKSDVVLHSDKDFIQSDSELILKGIRKKSENIYPSNTTLIVQSSLTGIYGVYEWEKLMSILKIGIPLHDFEEIFIYDPVQEYSYSFWNVKNTT